MWDLHTGGTETRLSSTAEEAISRGEEILMPKVYVVTEGFYSDYRWKKQTHRACRQLRKKVGSV